MLIAFIGDVHGCVFHAMVAVLALQQAQGRRLDAIVQVGDFSAFPSRDRLATVDGEYIASSPAQGDLFRLLDPAPVLVEPLRPFRDELARPVTVISGNHEDHAWLAKLHQAYGETAAPIDGAGIFEHAVANTSYALANLVPPKSSRHGAEPLNPHQRVAPGSIGGLDTAPWTFRYVTDAWLADIADDTIDLAALDAFGSKDRDVETLTAERRAASGRGRP